MASLLVFNFCFLIHNNNRQITNPISILEATAKLKSEPNVDHWIASGVVDQMATTDRKAK